MVTVCLIFSLYLDLFLLPPYWTKVRYSLDNYPCPPSEDMDPDPYQRFMTASVACNFISNKPHRIFLGISFACTEVLMYIETIEVTVGNKQNNYVAVWLACRTAPTISPFWSLPSGQNSSLGIVRRWKYVRLLRYIGGSAAPFRCSIPQLS